MANVGKYTSPMDGMGLVFQNNSPEVYCKEWRVKSSPKESRIIENIHACDWMI